MSTETGKVIQVIGPVVDVEFPPGHLPNIYNALKITRDADSQTGQSAAELTMEVAQHLGENRVRAVAMSSTDGLVRGLEVRDSGGPISVPVGRETLGSGRERVGRAGRWVRSGFRQENVFHSPVGSIPRRAGNQDGSVGNRH